MLKNRQISIAIMLSLFAIPCWAKVTPVHEYNAIMKSSNTSDMESGEEEKLSCETYGYYEDKNSDELHNATCTSVKLADGQTCYDCKCDTFQYQYASSDCATDGFTTSSTYCSTRKETRYATCPCNEKNGWYSDSQYVANVLNSYSLSEDGKASITGSGKNPLTCYKAGSFSCPSDYTKLPRDKIAKFSGSTVTLTADGEYIKYSIKSNFETTAHAAATICTNSVSFSTPLRSSTPSSTGAYICAEYTSGKTSYLNKTYYYYTGCSENDGCTTSMKNCIAYDSVGPLTLYDATNKKTNGSVTCRKEKGCSSGLVKNKDGNADIFCVTSAPSAGFAKTTTTTDNNKTCYQITGCANGYKKACPTTSALAGNGCDASAYKTDTTYTYDVHTATGGSNTLLCRIANGCNVNSGYYNFGCSEGGCWDGKLSWWL